MAKNSIDAYGASGKSNVLFSNRKVCIWLPIQHTRFTMNEYTYRLMKL